MRLFLAIAWLACACVTETLAALFQNLDFESPFLPLVPVSPGDPHVPLTNAFPGWQGWVGTTSEPLAFYNDFFLASASISLFGPEWPASGRIEGNYTASLMSGHHYERPSEIVSASLSQTGDVPANTRWLLFNAFVAGEVSPGIFSVSLGGQNLDLVPLDTGPNYTQYGADVSAFAGQTEDLRFTALVYEPYVAGARSGLWLDSISFSPVPEPSSVALTTLGLVAVGLV